MEFNLFEKNETCHLPYNLSHPLEQAQAAFSDGRYGMTMNHLLDFFEIASCYCSFVFLRLLEQVDDGQKDARAVLQQTVQTIDRKRPLSMGDWQNSIFTPLLKTLCRCRPNTPLAASFGKNVLIQNVNTLMGSKTQRSIVQIRNEYRGHETVLSDTIYRGVIDELRPSLRKMIGALAPLNDCRYDIREGIYRIDFPDNTSIDLYPLVFENGQGFRYAFHTLKGEQASYISANEEATVYTGYDMNGALDATFQRILPSFDIAKDLNWQETLEGMKAISEAYLQRVYAEKKYDSELFVERADFTGLLDAFKNSDRAILPLIGEAGQGKTNQLAFWTSQLLDQNRPVMTFCASDFTTTPLDSTLQTAFGFRTAKDMTRFVDSVERMAVEADEQVYVIFDAVNECLSYASKPRQYAADEEGEEGPLRLYRAICRLFTGPRRTRFKVILTCRNYTWDNVILPSATDQRAAFYTADGKDVMMRGFNRDDTRRAYEIYKKRYNLQTAFDDLDRRVQLRLEDPLMMKTTATLFRKKELPAEPTAYTSIALYDQLYRSIDESDEGDKQCSILNGLGDILLAAYLRGDAADGVAVGDLRAALADAHSPLHHLATLMYKAKSVTSAYDELLNNARRPVLREVVRQGKGGPQLYVQFIYERFLEFVLAKAFVRQSEEMTAEGIHQALRGAAANVVLLGAMRNAVIMGCLKDGHFGTVVALERQWGEDYRSRVLVNGIIDTLISEHYEDELFALLPQLIDCEGASQGEIEEFNELVRRIQNNEADDETFQHHRELTTRLAPIFRLKKLASVSLVNGILLSDLFNEHLYRHDALSLLWRLMDDNVSDVRNDTCMYVYYLSKRAHTLTGAPLAENLTVLIIRMLYARIKQHSLIRNLLLPRTRHLFLSSVETASRLAVLLIIDNMLAAPLTEENKRVAALLFDEMKAFIRYATSNRLLTKAVLSVLQIGLRRQVTFQSDYVNNVMEYQTFWQDNTFHDISYHGTQWTPADIQTMTTFCHHYQRFYSNKHSHEAAPYRNTLQAECDAEEQRWSATLDKVISAYKSGDSLSYFVLERVLVIMGASNWKNVVPVARAFFTDEFRSTTWFDYSQMSILYVLYQIACQTRTTNHELLELYTREAVDWTVRLRGFFRGRRSEKTNPRGLYKRNLMSWYAAVYCSYTTEGKALESDARPIPAFYALIDKAIIEGDRELLIHLIDNIMELITDMGLHETALDLTKYIMSQLSTQEQIDRIDQVPIQRSGIYEYGLVKLIGNVLSTAKSYCPQRVDRFLRTELSTLSFPGIASYQDSILSYTPSGETLQDLMTHKVGNFLIYALLHLSAVDDFAIEGTNAATRAPNSSVWFEQVVKILLRHLFH